MDNPKYSFMRQVEKSLDILTLKINTIKTAALFHDIPIEGLEEIKSHIDAAIAVLLLRKEDDDKNT